MLYRDGICPIFGTHNTSYFTDKYADREIKDLIVICENNENGCAWSGRLGMYEVRIHSENTIFFKVIQTEVFDESIKKNSPTLTLGHKCSNHIRKASLIV